MASYCYLQVASGGQREMQYVRFPSLLGSFASATEEDRLKKDRFEEDRQVWPFTTSAMPAMSLSLSAYVARASKYSCTSSRHRTSSSMACQLSGGVVVE
jgi:hypothetical protein